MENIFGACIDAIKGVWELIAKFRTPEHDMNALRSRIDELNAREKDVMVLLEREEVGQGKKRKREVDLWLKNVKRIKNEVNSIERKVRAERGWISHYYLRNSIDSMSIEVARLQEKSEFSDGVAFEPLLHSGRALPTATLLGESANTTLERIQSLILDVNVRKLGVYGMAGVGKTSIMKHINNRLLKSHSFGSFESIIWVTVSEALDLQRLQCEIARSIGLDLSNDCANEESIASKICAKLSGAERCLFILDDVWRAFSLERIGIPEPNQTNGFKLVITSRSLEVCRGIESERIIKVEVLSNDEAWDLFKEKVGGHVLGFLEIDSIAKNIIKECGRLPLALITVGRALREVGDVHVWRNALDELKTSCTNIDGMNNDVIPRLMFSYNRLKNDRLRDCFLYCALYPEDYNIKIEELVENWMGEGLVDEVGDMKKVFDRGYTIVNELKDACMIEDGRLQRHVRLHDLIRDLAIKITRTKPKFLVEAREHSRESPILEEWMEDTERLSLTNNETEVLSNLPICPALCTSILKGNSMLREISDSFFECIRGLKVLDLSFTLIDSLPGSFSKLVELRVLQLNHCWKLRKLPSVARLKQLRILRLSSSAIDELPHGMEELVHLRSLHLSCTKHLQMLPAGLIPKLSSLENFRMDGSRWRWVSESTERGIVVANVEEIRSLTRLAYLSLSFRDAQGFNKLVGLEKLESLESFDILVGATSFLGSTILDYCAHGADHIHHRFAVQVHDDVPSPLLLPFNTRTFEIKNCYNITRLSGLTYLAKATQIKECSIFGCLGMEFIIMADEKISPNLESLNLNELPNLRGLSDGNAPIQTFENLSELSVTFCSKMKSLLTIEWLKCLPNLEILSIECCDSMEEILADGGNDSNGTFSFPKLVKLDLTHLGNLKRICKAGFTFPSLRSIASLRCYQLKTLPFTRHNLPPSLKEIQGLKWWWDELEWDDPSVKTHLQDRFVDYFKRI